MTKITFAAKITWNYHGEYFEICKDGLAIAENYIKEYVGKQLFEYSGIITV